MEMDFEQIVQKILGTGLSRDEAMARIKGKQDEYGLLTPEGAAAIVARELGIIIERKEPEVKPLYIADLVPQMSKVDIVGRVVRVYEPKDFSRSSGKPGMRGGIVIRDGTGSIRLTLWDEKTDLIKEGMLKKGDVVRVVNAYVRRGLDKRLELSLGMRGNIMVSPDDPRVQELPPVFEANVRLVDLKPEMGEVDVVGRVVAASDMRVFERPDGTQGKVSSIIITDSSGKAVRVSLWNGWAEFAKNLKRNDAVKLENSFVKSGLKDQVELSLGSQGRLVTSPPEEKDIPEIPLRPLKVGEVEVGMPSLEIAAVVRRKLQPVEFKRADGSQGRVISLILADETGTIRASFWDSAVELVQKVQSGDVILLKNAYSRTGLSGAAEIHVGGAGAVEVNPAGVKVSEPGPTRVKIMEVEPNMDCLEMVGRVLEVSGPREFTRQGGSKGAVASIQISDGTATVRVSLWGEHAAKAGEIKSGDVVRLVDAYSALGQFGSVEVHLGKMGNLEVNPPGVEQPPKDLQNVPAPPAPRKSIAELEKEGERAEVRGTLVQVFHRRPIFDVCPSCGKSLRGAETSLTCEECGKSVIPEHRLVLSFLLDDGTGNIRVALFGKIAEKFLGMDTQRLFEMFKSTQDVGKFYDELKLLGKELLITGVTRHDTYFDQLELRGYEVGVPDPQDEAWAQLQKLKGETE